MSMFIDYPGCIDAIPYVCTYRIYPTHIEVGKVTGIRFETMSLIYIYVKIYSRVAFIVETQSFVGA